MIPSINGSLQALNSVINLLNRPSTSQGKIVGSGLESQNAGTADMDRLLNQQFEQNQQMQEISIKSTSIKNIHDALMSIIRNSRVS